MAVQWNHFDEPDELTSRELTQQITLGVHGELHDVVRKHLLARGADSSHAFPRFEVHFDRYLFGYLQLPTSLDDGVAEFAELTIVATHNDCWTVFRVPTHEVNSELSPTPIAEEFRRRLAHLQERSERDGNVGELIGRLFTVVVNELEKVMVATSTTIQKCAVDLDSVDGRHLSRAMKEEVPGIRQRATDVRSEVASLGIVIDELSLILDDIVHDRLDLRGTNEDGSENELFDQHTEIHLRDTYYRSRRLRIVHDEQLEKLSFIFDTIGHLNDADEVTSGRFMGAIASIMLLPTFIVGLYGMNFDSMPELHWPVGYGFAAILIVVITVFQIWYFRRKRWL